jgi:hypothetical protein
VVNFPTRICDQSSASIDNVFIDISRFKNITVSPVSNGLSDHEGHVLTLVLPLPQLIEYQFYTYRKINTFTVTDFLNQLSYENWEEVFGESNVDQIFNAFLNSYLRIFNSYLPLTHKQKITKRININWITTGIRVSCAQKRPYI